MKTHHLGYLGFFGFFGLLGFSGHPALVSLFGFFGLFALFTGNRQGSGTLLEQLAKCPRWALAVSLLAVVAVAASTFYYYAF
jgi:uncharacterized protein DUF3796